MGLLTILYRDEHLVVIDKPENVLVHRSRQARDHVVVLQLLRDQLGRHVFPVHRLDRATSGVLAFALDSAAAAELVRQFTERTVDKRYLAIVRGRLEGEGCVDHELRDPDSGETRPAVTHYRGLGLRAFPWAVGPHDQALFSLVELRPRTGRTHQIRRHMKHLSHPVLGDTCYGDGRHNRLAREKLAIHRLMLHARSLALLHPSRGTPMTFEAPVPVEFDLFREDPPGGGAPGTIAPHEPAT